MHPNIIYIDCHDLGDWLGCYDRSYLNTPNLDQLAAEGARFDQYISTAPICMPSRAGIYTGQMPHCVGVHGQFSMQAGAVCMAEWFTRGGYESILVGSAKMHNTPTDLGFQSQVDVPDHSTLASTAVHWIQDQGANRSQPFFVSISFNDVHRPFGNHYEAALPDQLTVPPYLPDCAIVRRDLATLHRAIEGLDAQVGQILNAVKSAGQEENTLIVFTTEHGPAIGRAKHTLYDSGLRCALLIKYPRFVDAGRVYGELLSNLDLLPTLLDLAGVDIPDEHRDRLHGRTFANLLADQEYVERSAVFAEHSWGRRAGLYHHTPSRAVRTKEYKYIRNFTDTPPYIDTDWLARFGPQRQLPQSHFGHPAPEEELYDLSVDPHELNNVAMLPEHKTTCHQLRHQLTGFLNRTNDPILDGPIPHPKGLPDVPLWEKQPDGSFWLRRYREEESGEGWIDD
ncbi:MAG: sulfatase [Chloroflexota bacterium]